MSTAAAVTPRAPFTARLTPNFSLGELALWVEARRFSHQHQVNTAVELCAFLEKVRAHFGGRPVRISSGYRPPMVNRAVGGATSSEHLFSVASEGAVDFSVPGISTLEVQRWCDVNWGHSLGYGAAQGFVHLGRRADGRRRRWNY